MPTKTLSDKALLATLQEEMRQAVGFENDSLLTKARELALDYIKGEMPDVQALAGRSKAVSSDVADAIETALSDLLEIFIGGEDVVSFKPKGEDDVESARRETDLVRQVVFEENNGALALEVMLKDALTSKLGVVMSYWEEEPSEPIRKDGLDPLTATVLASAQPDISMEQGEDGTWAATLQPPPKGHVCILNVPPEDYAVSRDAVFGKPPTYEAMRSRPRVQDLIKDGVEADQARDLPSYGVDSNTQRQARDTAGESTFAGVPEGTGDDDLRQVEVVAHFIRRLDGDKMVIHRVLTDADCTRILERDTMGASPFSVITPYIVPHRFYGQSVADKLIPLQRQNTAIKRGFLDSIYFGLNQRLEVDMQKANEWTVPDLLRNEPGVPVRVNGEGALRPIQAGGPNVDYLAAIEHTKVEAEQATGIVRNAQGLNPDTLHDTAGGAAMLLGAAQKRMRKMARSFAQTGIKDLMLKVHALLREQSQQLMVGQQRGKWVQTDPREWPERTDMTVEIGLGASGRNHDLAMALQLSPVIQGIVQMQGGPQGPIITPGNIYAFTDRILTSAGFKQPERFVTDPANAPQTPPKPDPAMAKVQAESQAHQQRMQMEGQAKQQQMAMEAQAKAADQHADAQAKSAELQQRQAYDMAKLEQEGRLRLRQIELEYEARMFQLRAEIDLSERETNAKLALAEQAQRHGQKLDEDIQETRLGGDEV